MNRMFKIQYSADKSICSGGKMVDLSKDLPIQGMDK